MDKRFAGSSLEKPVHKTHNFKIDTKQLKTIKVEIKRKISGNNETKELDHSLQKPEEFKIYRCQGEGSRPIFDRSDIVVNKEEVEHRTVSSYSPQRSPSRVNNSHKSSDNYTSFDSDSPRREQDSPRRKNSRHSRSPKRDNKVSKSHRNSSSPHRDRPSTSRREYISSSSRNRSRSRDDNRRSRRSRSRSRSSRREFGRRRFSRSPHERDRRYDRRHYGPTERNRRRERSRSPRYVRSSRRRSRSRTSHMAPIDPTTVIPLIIPPFYGPEDAVWFPPPMRPPLFVPPGVPMPPRGLYRPPMPGMRPPIPGRPPYMPPGQPPFRQIRPQPRPPNFPQLQQ